MPADREALVLFAAIVIETVPLPTPGLGDVETIVIHPTGLVACQPHPAGAVTLTIAWAPAAGNGVPNCDTV
jgi:hypothetical protein